MRTSVAAVIVLTGVMAGGAAATLPDTLLDPYLRLQMALATDTSDTVKHDAAALASAANAIGKPAKPIASAAEQMAQAETLGKIREAFGRVSDALLAYAKATGAAQPAGVNIAFCPMAKRSWIQKGEDTRNPYYGSAMLSCGEIQKSRKQEVEVQAWSFWTR